MNHLEITGLREDFSSTISSYVDISSFSTISPVLAFESVSEVLPVSIEEPSIENSKFNLENIKLVKESLQAIFPDNWELQYNDIDNLVIIYVKFPLITIVNSNDLSHTIKDLYVRICCDTDMKFSKMFKIEGFRGKLTYNEFKSGYSHSHLPSFSFDSFSNFCLGIGTEIDILRADLIDNSIPFIQERLEQFLYMLEVYVRWESLEGVPHIKMENICFSQKDINFDIDNNILDIYYIDFICNTSTFNCFYNQVKDIITVSFDELEKLITFYHPSFPMVYKSSSGKYFSNILDKDTINKEIALLNSDVPFSLNLKEKILV